MKITELTKKYRGRTVIDRLTLVLPESGRVALLGPSGSGKTTLLNILAGLDRHYSGVIEPRPGKYTVSMSFQDPALLPWRTAAENVNVALGDTAATLPRAEELLRELGLAQTGAYPDELSGGMKARVGIARALARQARLYLFDEPFAALDPDTAAAVSDVIARHTDGALTVAVIHDPPLALAFAPTVIRFTSVPLRARGFEVLAPRTELL